jgi:hypothetical protein
MRFLQYLTEQERYIAIKDAPDWVKKILKSERIGKDLRVKIGTSVDIGGNWHDGNVRRVYLYAGGKIKSLSGAGGMGVNDSPSERRAKQGFATQLTPDKMILITNTYPKMAELYVHPDAIAKMIAEPEQQLSAAEYLVLVATRGLKASYQGRPIRKDTCEMYGVDYDTTKAQLISKGLLNRNGAINKNGKNALLARFDRPTIDPDSAARELKLKKTGRGYY